MWIIILLILILIFLLYSSESFLPYRKYYISTYPYNQNYASFYPRSLPYKPWAIANPWYRWRRPWYRRFAWY